MKLFQLLFVWFALIVGGLCFNGGPWSVEAAEQGDSEQRPNIILFIADDMSWNDAEPYGHPHIRTPNLQRLAEGGLTFDQAFLTTSSCSPTRCSLITGRYPHSTGAPNLHEPLPADQTTFVGLLKEAGYYTGAFGKWHMGPHAKQDFHQVNGKLNGWQQTLKKRKIDQPFFYWIATTDPHRPYQSETIPQPHQTEETIVPPFLLDNEETREDLAAYYDEITRLDGEVGRITDVLHAEGIAENTLLIFISDNGRPFPRCKTTIYDSGIKTPMFCYWPKKIPAGQRTAALTSTLDIAPTVLELAGQKATESFQGRPFTTLLTDPQSSYRDYIFAEKNWHDFDFRERGVRSKRFKYIQNRFPENPATPPADAVRSPSYQALLTANVAGILNEAQAHSFVKPRPQEEFYDLQNDPFELKNLAGTTQFQAEQEKLKQELQRWSRDTNDAPSREPIPQKFDRVTGERIAPRTNQTKKK